MIRFGCPACNAVISTSSKRAGTVKACPNCNQQVQVPDAAAFKQAARDSRVARKSDASKPAAPPRRKAARAFWALVRMSLWGLCFGLIVLGVVSYFIEAPKQFKVEDKTELAVRTLVWIVGPYYLARTFQDATLSLEALLQKFRRKR